ncbi:PP2C family protein-serine/threonine phosphatase [Gymnodinialimonas ulvae]|uniref:PP2C family protein-serine/threonine phosphatase n=1 Tax=Gymnodinialimonas ulvae TaxID=3126504 RepID=UPI0030A80928
MTHDSHSFEYDVASALAKGARTRQEDALAVAFADGAPDGFAILSDGMGGHVGGDLASRAIVTEVFAALTLDEVARRSVPPVALRRAVSRANDGLQACVTSNPERAGMGGTLVAAHVADGAVHWASVGDSVLYLFRNQTLARLNADHSMAPQLDLMAANGSITEAEAAAHPQRNCLTAALTGDAIAEVDCPEAPLDLKPEDILILASDGLQFLPDPIIEALLLRARNESSRAIARDLLDALETLNDPEQDNTSLVVIRPVRTKSRERQSSLLQTSSAMFKAVRRAVAPTVHIDPKGS